MKLRHLFVVLFLMIVLSGCSKEEAVDAKGKCTVAECMEMVDVDNSVADINEIIGVDGILVDAGYNEYYWEISEDTGIYVTYYDTDVGEIRVEIPDELIASRKLSFAKINEIETLVNDEDSLDYQKLINMLGDVEGVLIEKNTDSLTYKWVDNGNKYLNATFSRDTGKCIMLTGMY